MRPVIANILKTLAVIIAIPSVGYFALPHLVCLDLPKARKLTDCTNSVLMFSLTCEHSPSYQFVLGLSTSQSETTGFRGEIVIQQGYRKVITIPITSQDMTRCNWLPGLDGRILTWNRTNAGERLSEVLRQGQTYDVRVAFSETPSADNSLWFCSMGKAKLW